MADYYIFILKIKMSGKRSPYKIQARRVSLSRPFQTVQDVRSALIDYNKGNSIGFSRVSSLVAMGLLPRSDGYFRVSTKYK